MGPNDVMHVVVRREASADQDRVDAIVRDAFGQAAEAELVARLRTVPGCLSLVGVVDVVVVGHALFTAELRRSGAGRDVVLGHRAYDPRFGFVAAAPLGMGCKWGGEDGSSQVLELVPGAARVHRGSIDYHRAFDAFASPTSDENRPDLRTVTSGSPPIPDRPASEDPRP